MPVTCTISVVCAKSGKLYQIEDHPVSERFYIQFDDCDNRALNLMIIKILEKHPSIVLDTSDDSIGFTLSAWGSAVTDKEAYQEALEK